MQLCPTKIALNGVEFQLKDQECNFCWEVSQTIQPENSLVLKFDLTANSKILTDHSPNSVRNDGLSGLEADPDFREQRSFAVLEMVVLEIVEE